MLSRLALVATVRDPPPAAREVWLVAASVQVGRQRSAVEAWLDSKTYQIQALGDDSYTVLVAGVPVGRIVYSFGAANGVPEGDAISEDDLTLIGESWLAAIG